jgi:hypothetical protein
MIVAPDARSAFGDSQNNKNKRRRSAQKTHATHGGSRTSFGHRKHSGAPGRGLVLGTARWTPGLANIFCRLSPFACSTLFAFRQVDFQNNTTAWGVVNRETREKKVGAAPVWLAN